MLETDPHTNQVSEQEASVVVYGTRWCAATQIARRMLERLKVSYQFRDIDSDQQASKQVRWWTGGYASHPTIQIAGKILVEPTPIELEQELAQNGLI
ncbi:MAG: glutaredoxin family protein [Anaerolineaceae bacterium]|nr:glutaredoxin family protein [Anaerolineaceae bacterium]